MDNKEEDRVKVISDVHILAKKAAFTTNCNHK